MNTRLPPSVAVTFSTVTAAESLSFMVPVAVSVSVTSGSDADKVTVNVSSPSKTASLVVETVNGCVSPAVPVKLIICGVLS